MNIWAYNGGQASALCVSAGVRLSEGQRTAVAQASVAPVMVLTGGPGCGKTFTTRTIVKLWRAMGKRCAMAAPTGAPKAARALLGQTHLIGSLWVGVGCGIRSCSCNRSNVQGRPTSLSWPCICRAGQAAPEHWLLDSGPGVMFILML